MSTTTLHIPAREVLPGDEVTVTLKVTISREWDHMLWNIADVIAGFGVVVAPDAILTVRREDSDAEIVEALRAADICQRKTARVFIAALRAAGWTLTKTEAVGA
ncbi:MAG: hypothetical protein IPM11_00640 [Micropruina sp.]|nr:hypothetical protein [Micropruina sp.]